MVDAELWARGVLVALASVAAAVLADGAPTGHPALDAVERGLLAAVVVLAACAARSWTLVWMAGMLAVTAAGSTGAIVAGAALLAVAGAGTFLANPPPVLFAGVATAATVLALRLPDVGPPGTTAIAVVVAVAPVVVSGWRNCGDRAWRAARRVARLAAWTAGFVSLLFLGAMALMGRAGGRAVDEAAAWRAATQRDDPAGARAHLAEADQALDELRGVATAPWTRPARALPGASAHLDAVAAVGDAVGAMTRAAVTASASSGVDDLVFRKGRFDLAAISRTRDPLARTIDAADRADRAVDSVDRTWLLPPVRAALDDLAAAAREVAREGEVALGAVDAAPALLGGDAPRRYLVLVGTPSEARELGGAAKAFAELTVTDGELVLSRTGGVAELDGGLTDAQAASLDRTAVVPPRPADQAPRLDPARFPESYVRSEPGRFWENITGTADFPVVASAAAELYPASGGRPVDGVVFLDPVALAGLLRITGPVEVTGLPFALTPDNAVGFLLRDQYVEHARATGPADFLQEVTRLTFERLMAADASGPRALAGLLGPLVEQRHLHLWSSHREDQAFLRRAGVDGALPPGTPDFLGVTLANDNTNLADAYLRHEVAYGVRYDLRTGRVQATARITLVNELPTGRELDGLPTAVAGNPRGLPKGANRTFLAVSTPLVAQQLLVGGFVFPMESTVEHGRNRFGQYVEVPAGGRVEVVLELAGTVDLADGYGVTVWSPPMAVPGQVRVHAEPTGPAAGPSVDGSIDGSGVLRLGRGT